MSTKASLAHGEGFHFYNEIFDEQHVYLELRKAEFEVTQDHVMVRIPLEVWITIQRIKPPHMDVMHKSDQELLEMARNDVDQRIAHFKAARIDQTRVFGAHLGSFVYGDADKPRSVQIKLGMRHYLRERKQQRVILERSRAHRFIGLSSSDLTVDHLTTADQPITDLSTDTATTAGASNQSPRELPTGLPTESTTNPTTEKPSGTNTEPRKDPTCD
jgi:hypothetical protein